MVDLLEQPEIRRLVTPMSVETYHLLAELGPDVQPCELIRGIVVDKTDKISRSRLHIFLVGALFDLFQAAAQPLQRLVLKEDPITLTDSEPEPDISVVAGQRRDYRHTRVTTALLVVEVAVTSLPLDRVKAALYAGANIPEYWIVLAPEKAVEVYTAPADGLYTQLRTYRVGETLTSPLLPALRVDLAALFAD